MKKLLIMFLLLTYITSFSQTDTTGKQIAKDSWMSNPNNINKPIPIWDNDGNVVGFFAISLMLIIYYKRLGNNPIHRIRSF